MTEQVLTQKYKISRFNTLTFSEEEEEDVLFQNIHLAS